VMLALYVVMFGTVLPNRPAAPVSTVRSLHGHPANAKAR
jgi:hypothetical protein